LYTISSKGFKELQPFGISHFTRYRPADTHTLKLPHLQHLISLNDFLIAARLLCRANPDITLVSMLHDLDMKRTPMRVTIDRQTFSIVPDGFLDFRLSIAGRLYALPVWVEIDKGTEWGNSLKLKLRKIISAIQSIAFQELFGVTSCTVAISTINQKRIDLMVSFIRQELQSMGLTHLAHVFLITALSDGLLDPKELFLHPMWFTPDTSSPIALLDLND
jgi:hypothetical protein